MLVTSKSRRKAEEDLEEKQRKRQEEEVEQQRAAVAQQHNDDDHQDVVQGEAVQPQDWHAYSVQYFGLGKKYLDEIKEKHFVVANANTTANATANSDVVPTPGDDEHRAPRMPSTLYPSFEAGEQQLQQPVGRAAA